MSTPNEETPTPLTDEKEFVGQAEWAEDNSPLLSCVEADFARTLERRNTDLELQCEVNRANAAQFMAERDAMRAAQTKLHVKLIEILHKYGTGETEDHDGEKISEMVERIVAKRDALVKERDEAMNAYDICSKQFNLAEHYWNEARQQLTAADAKLQQSEAANARLREEDFCKWCYDRGLRYSSYPWRHAVDCPKNEEKTMEHNASIPQEIEQKHTSTKTHNVTTAYKEAFKELSTRYIRLIASRDEWRKVGDFRQKIITDLRTENEKLREALEKQHQWHLDQTERTPVFFGDTIGQVNADEYTESGLAEATVAALYAPAVEHAEQKTNPKSDCAQSAIENLFSLMGVAYPTGATLDNDNVVFEIDEIANRVREMFSENAALTAKLQAAQGDASKAKVMLCSVVDAQYGAGWHHIGDGDGISDEEADEIRAYLDAMKGAE